MEDTSMNNIDAKNNRSSSKMEDGTTSKQPTQLPNNDQQVITTPLFLTDTTEICHDQQYEKIIHPLHILNQYYISLKLQRSVPSDENINSGNNEMKNIKATPHSNDVSVSQDHRPIKGINDVVINDDTLRLVDFLFGSSSNNNYGKESTASTMVEDTIRIIDIHYYNYLKRMTVAPPFDTNVTENNTVGATATTSCIKHQMFQNKKFNNGTNVITRFISPHGRCVYLVVNHNYYSNKRTMTKKQNIRDDNDESLSHTTSTIQVQDDDMHSQMNYISQAPETTTSIETSNEPSCFLCIVPDHILDQDRNVSASTFMQSLYYCSCTVYLDECTKQSYTQQMNPTYNRTTATYDPYHNIIICPHILAIQLLPIFDLDYITTRYDSPIRERDITSTTVPTMEFVSEDDYSRAILQRILS